ncbi:hypothetical protein BC826DRAFT_1105323 [Russula brevipes]|nr:hypothetical protein BC826DRAFT_1105323 [Russula brevipes]
MNNSPQVRSSAWLYLFDLATCAQQLERASSKFSQFVDNRRQFRDVHVNAFVRRCVELRCPGLALTVFSDRPAYRMDLTLTAARQLLYAFHEERQLSNVVALAALFPVYNLRALSSDPISCALFVVCLPSRGKYFRLRSSISSRSDIFVPFQTAPLSDPSDASFG